MPRPVHFEIHASDPAVSSAFYEHVFGWTFSQFGDFPYWLVSTGGEGEPGIDGGLLPRPGPPPEPGQGVNAFVVVVDVPSCTEYFEKALAAGATEALPVTAVPGVGWSAYVKDPDGNIIGLMQDDPGAA